MESPNNTRDNVTTRHLLPPCETSSARNGLHLIELLAKGTPWKLPNIPFYLQDKAIGHFPQTNRKTLLPKTILIYLFEHREVELMPK